MSEDARAAIEFLVERFPTCFSLYEWRRRPLKVGIRDDIAAADNTITLQQIRHGLARYCGSDGYLSAMRAGAARIDLDGNVVGAVTEEQAAGAAKGLRARRIKVAARK